MNNVQEYRAPIWQENPALNNPNQGYGKFCDHCFKNSYLNLIPIIGFIMEIHAEIGLEDNFDRAQNDQSRIELLQADRPVRYYSGGRLVIESSIWITAIALGVISQLAAVVLSLWTIAWLSSQIVRLRRNNLLIENIQSRGFDNIYNEFYFRYGRGRDYMRHSTLIGMD